MLFVGDCVTTKRSTDWCRCSLAECALFPSTDVSVVELIASSVTDKEIWLCKIAAYRSSGIVNSACRLTHDAGGGLH
jgi:hypothetical protein